MGKRGLSGPGFAVLPRRIQSNRFAVLLRQTRLGCRSEALELLRNAAAQTLKSLSRFECAMRSNRSLNAARSFAR